MKKILLLSVVFAFACTNNTETDNTTTEANYTVYGDSTLTTHVKVDEKKSTVKWMGYKITEGHVGIINIQKGVLMIEHGTLVGGQISIDMTSIENIDQKGKGKANLEGHLKSDDFFNVEKFPLAVITITNAVKSEGSSYKIIADLTIKGIKHSISFDADVKIKDLNYLATAKIKIDRTKWDIVYNSGNFFKDLGDKLILDEIDFDILLLSGK